MKKAASIKPKKKTDAELFELLAKNIRNGNYIFLTHAKIRLKDRMISDIEVIDILEGKIGRKRKRNKAKDKTGRVFIDRMPVHQGPFFSSLMDAQKI